MKRFNEGGSTGGDSSWYGDIWDTVTDYGGDALDWLKSMDSDDLQKLLAGGGGLATLLGMTGIGGDFFQGGTSRPTGYQGTIPKYTATRTRLPQDPNAPAGTGKRYFSDVTFEKQPDPAQQGVASTTQGTQQGSQQQFAQGGLASLGGKGYYLGGSTDGMADEIPATINGDEPAALSDGEFVIPADVVSHLGNGNSEAGAQVLYDFMDRIRMARTGKKEQGKEINPEKMLPKRGMA